MASIPLGGRDDVELGLRLSFSAGNPLLFRTNTLVAELMSELSRILRLSALDNSKTQGRQFMMSVLGSLSARVMSLGLEYIRRMRYRVGERVLANISCTDVYISKFT